MALEIWQRKYMTLEHYRSVCIGNKTKDEYDTGSVVIGSVDIGHWKCRQKIKPLE